MVEHLGPPDAVHDAVQFEVWLAERELLSSAMQLRDLIGQSPTRARLDEARIGYQAAWLRFMVSLCNLPLPDRPPAVEHALDALRAAHALRSDGILPGRDVAPQSPSPPEGSRHGPTPPAPEGHEPPADHPPAPPEHA